MATEDEVKLLDEEGASHDSDNDKEDTVFIETNPSPSHSTTKRNSKWDKVKYYCCKLIPLPVVSSYIAIYVVGHGVIEGTYSIPLLLTVGASLQYTGVVYALSYMCLICVHLLFKSCRLGRRPFIVLLSLVSCVGLTIAPFVPYLSSTNTVASSSTTNTLIMIVTATSIILLVFSLGLIQLTTRPYLFWIDQKVESTLSPSQSVMTQNFTYIIAVSMMLMTIYSVGYIVRLMIPDIMNEEPTVLRQCQFLFVFTLIYILFLSLLSLCKRSIERQGETSLCCNNTKEEPSLCQLCLFIITMSKDMWLLCISVFLSGISIFLLMLYFTTIITQSMFHGILPNSPHDIQAFEVYSKGIYEGCLILAIGASLFFTLFCLFFLSPLVKYVSLRSVFLTIQYIFVLTLFVFSYWSNKLLAVSVMACALVVCYCTYEAVPFGILMLFKEDNRINQRGDLKEILSQNAAITILNTTYLLSKLTGALLVCPFIMWLGVGTSVVAISCVTSVLGAVVASFITIPSFDNNNN